MKTRYLLKQSLIRYPTLYDNKMDICRHFFVVNGNGYDWENGELVEPHFRDLSMKNAIQLQKDKLSKAISEIDDDRDGYFDIMKGIQEKRYDGYIETINNWKEIISSELVMTPKMTSELYPICQYAKIITIPDDITDDWLKLAKEFYQTMMDNYDHLSDNNKEWVKKVKFPR